MTETLHRLVWRSWTLTKIAVFGVSAGASFVLLASVALWLYSVYADRPKSWDAKALTVNWTDVKFLEDENGNIATFLFDYGVTNNTDGDYELRKQGVTIMTSLGGRRDSLIPADFYYSLGRDNFFLPSRQTSLIELRIDGGCSSNGVQSNFYKPDIFDQINPGGRGKSVNPSKSGQADQKCFDRYTRDLGGIVLFDRAARYRIDLPKPNRTFGYAEK